jgi:hypothetical protein
MAAWRPWGRRPRSGDAAEGWGSSALAAAAGSAAPAGIVSLAPAGEPATTLVFRRSMQATLLAFPSANLVHCICFCVHRLVFCTCSVFLIHHLLWPSGCPSNGFCVCTNCTPVQHCQQQRSALPQQAASTAPLLSAAPRSLPTPAAQWPLPGPEPLPRSCTHEREDQI